MFIMSTIITALTDAIPFYIASIPIIILNLYIIKQKREEIKSKFNLMEVVFSIGFIFSVLFILSITIGNNKAIKLDNISWGNINFNPFDGLYSQYILSINGDMHSFVNLFGNILVFIPFGFFLNIYLKDSKSTRIKTLIITIIFSVSIEIIQLFQGRYFDLTDIISNTIGSIIGKAIFCYLNILFNNFFKKVELRCAVKNDKIKVYNLVQIMCCLIFLLASLFKI